MLAPLLFSTSFSASVPQPSFLNSQLPPRTPTSPRLNHIQVIGTHNSYHLEPLPAVLTLGQSEPYRRALPTALSAASEYSHVSLTEQLSRQHIRQLELDLFPDPDGGRFTQPLGLTLARLRDQSPPPAADSTAATLSAPGLKILHKPDFDYHSHTPTFIGALRELRAWSQKNPRHIPVLVILELKVSDAAPADLTALTYPNERALVAAMRSTPPWTDAQLATVETEILSVFAPSEILTPADVRGDAPTLRDAILSRGWPELDTVRGRILFALDNENALRDRYLALSRETGRPRLLFVSVPPEHPEAAWMKINNPVRDFALIQERVRAGFLVRTRADEELSEARANDTTRRVLAFASGAHFISTDFPEPDPRYSDYCVRIPGDTDFALNPVTASAKTSAAQPITPTGTP